MRKNYSKLCVQTQNNYIFLLFDLDECNSKYIYFQLIVLLLCAFATALPAPDNGYSYPKPAIPFDDSSSDIEIINVNKPTCPPGQTGSPPNCAPPPPPPPPPKPKVENEYLPPVTKPRKLEIANYFIFVYTTKSKN